MRAKLKIKYNSLRFNENRELHGERVPKTRFYFYLNKKPALLYHILCLKNKIKKTLT